MRNAKWWQSDAVVYCGCLFFLGAWIVAVHSKFYLLRLPFDDALMFYRYAINMHAGGGIAWNPGGAPVYGVTSPMWLLVIWIATLFSHSMLRVVVACSTIAGVFAMLAVAWAIWSNAESRLFRRFSFVLLVVLACSLTMFTFLSSAANGMETSFSYAALALLAGVALRWNSGRASWVWVALSGMLAFLSRPESALATCLLITIAGLYMKSARKREAWGAFGLLLSLIALQLLVCRLYFETPLPLSFYLKSQHSYIGYIGRWYPVTSAFENLRSCRIPLLLIGLFAASRDKRLLLLCLLPAAACMLYLTTTLQIMGFWARYYMPYSAFLIIVALLILDRRQHERELGRPAGRMPVFARVLLVMVCACLSLGLVPRRWVSGLDDVSEGKLLKYNAPEVSTNVSTALPLIPVDVLFENVTDRLVALLPNGSTVAASEVGYLGAAVPKVRILDLVGLNDTTITKHGFQMDSVLAQQPDVIWMPHPDYTQQRGVMLSNPHFLEAYDFYPGAANFGLAVRRSGPHHAQVEQAFEHFWREEYPNEKMEDHLARAVRWDGGYQVLHSN